MKYILINKELNKELIKKYELKKVEEDYYIDYWYELDIHLEQLINELKLLNINVNNIDYNNLNKYNKICFSYLIKF